MLSYLYRTYACGSSRKQQVAYFQRHKAADVCNDLIHFEKHIRRTPFLHFFTVNQQIEVQMPDILVTVYRNKISDSRRRIEAFAKFPRISLFTEFSLKITGSKIDTHSHGVIIAVSKTRSDVLPQTVDTDYQFRLIMYLVRKVRNEKRLAVL